MLEGRSLFFPNWCNTHKELKVDTWHWATENGEIFFVEKVVDSAFERPLCPRTMDLFFESYVAHIVFWQTTSESDIVARHSVTFALVTPFV